MHLMGVAYHNPASKTLVLPRCAIGFSALCCFFFVFFYSNPVINEGPGMFLASQGCAQTVIMQPVEVLAVDEWHDNVPVMV